MLVNSLPQNWVCSPCSGYDWIIDIPLKGTFLKMGALNLCPVTTCLLPLLPQWCLVSTASPITLSRLLPWSFALEPNHFGEWMNNYTSEWTCCLLLLLSRLSRVRLCATPWTAAHQAPPSLGFSRQEHWSGLPFPSPMHESEVAQPCLTVSDPMDCSLRGSPVHGIFQARVLEWGAIAFSGTCCLLVILLEPWYS